MGEGTSVSINDVGRVRGLWWWLEIFGKFLLKQSKWARKINIQGPKLGELSPPRDCVVAES